MQNIHPGTLADTLRDAIEHEAKVHGAAFDRKGFGKVMQTLADGDIEAIFYMAAWDIRPDIWSR